MANATRCNARPGTRLVSGLPSCAANDPANKSDPSGLDFCVGVAMAGLSMMGSLNAISMLNLRGVVASVASHVPFVADLVEVWATIEELRRTRPEEEQSVGESRECVALVKHFTNVGHISLWRKGDPVMGPFPIAPGTAIATFDNRNRFPATTGWHSALYVSEDADGITVVDQYPHPLKPIGGRYIRANSHQGRPNDAFMFSVIVH
jgi:hypothetical protein